MQTEAQKRASRKWNDANMVVLSCKIKKEIAEDFRQACAKLGSNTNTVLRAAVLETIAAAQDGAGGQNGKEE